MKRESKYNDPTNKLLLFLLIIIVIANCVQSYYFKANKRYDWTTNVISSKGNIVQVSNCTFKGNSYDINKNIILDNGWDKTNDTENNVKDTFFPDSLSIKWFSYSEQKFYNGSFALPNETIETKAIQMGMFPSVQNDHNDYRVLHFIAEVQQKGKIAVWIQKFDENRNSTKLKIATYHAKETKASWHIFDDSSETNKISEIDISKKVALVMERHFYKLNIKLPDGYTLNNSYFELFNQNIWRFSEQELKTVLSFDFLPKEFDLEWSNGKKNFTTQFSFDEDEVLETFRKESTNRDSVESLVLELVVNDHNDAIKVRLKNSKTNSDIIFKDKYQSKNERSIIQLRN